MWWFREEKKIVGNGLPDIFKRGENIVSRSFYFVLPSSQAERNALQTGSAHAILKGLPLLDPIQDDTKPRTCVAPPLSPTRPTADSPSVLQNCSHSKAPATRRHSRHLSRQVLLPGPLFLQTSRHLRLRRTNPMRRLPFLKRRTRSTTRT